MPNLRGLDHNEVRCSATCEAAGDGAGIDLKCYLGCILHAVAAAVQKYLNSLEKITGT